MKIASICLIGALVLTFSACKNANPQAVEERHQNEYAAQTDATDGVQRMGNYDFTDTLRIGNNTYLCHIHREPSDSLPTVKDDFGTEFADNIYRLRIVRNGVAFFDHTFTKAAFANLLGEELRCRGVLDGMRTDTTQAGLGFAVSISQPQSDIFQPLILTVDNTGGFAIARDTRTEIE